jgi:adenylate cyclase class 2
MPIEIEKKYRLTQAQAEELGRRLEAIGAVSSGTDFEVNTLYSSPTIDLDGAVLRLRRINNQGILTFKKRFPSASPIKRQLEEETEIADADSMHRILERLGFKPSLLYEKRRATWHYQATEIAIDELPFGWFMEIEGEELDIEEVERAIASDGLVAEDATYPALTRQHGSLIGEVIEARFHS